jgi:hypothetical protein
VLGYRCVGLQVIGTITKYQPIFLTMLEDIVESTETTTTIPSTAASNIDMELWNSMSKEAHQSISNVLMLGLIQWVLIAIGPGIPEPSKKSFDGQLSFID